ncbi:hypothetical protein GCM10022239_00770 [Leifsonia bigeumensis]|uniref:Uncharacterized protein n=1 Tax=Leifsonella bigeumensis TaxID=433643 RepID=A0ABP7F0B3_9MICO
MRVTDKYGLTTPVPFVNIHVERDNALYLDPSAIRNGTDSWSRRAHTQLVDFFTEVLLLRKSSLPADHAKGLALLQYLHEPNQTRLGVSARGIGGKAIGSGLAGELWDELGANPAAQSDALTRLEHLPVFLERVGPDLISDLTTRIIFGVLVDFTNEMMRRYPGLAAGATIESVPMYDPTTKQWRPVMAHLPYVAPHQILLIPKEWVFWRLLMWSEPFYNRYATTTVRFERGSYDNKGRFQGPLKKSLKSEFTDHRKLNNDQAVKYKTEQDRDLVIEYQNFVDTEFEPLSDAEIESRTD